MMLYYVLATLTISFGIVQGLIVSPPPQLFRPCPLRHHHHPSWRLQESVDDQDANIIIQPASALPTENDKGEDLLPEFVPSYTGLSKQCDWKLAMDPVPIQSELGLLESGVLWRPGEFCRIDEDSPRYDEISDKCLELGMTLAQGFLVRKQLSVTIAMKNTWKLKKHYPKIERHFRNKQQTLLQMSRDLSVPPVNIVREIVSTRVDNANPTLQIRDKKQMVKEIINERNDELLDTFLPSKWEREQLQIAKDFDVIGYSWGASEIGSSKWEQAIYAYLRERDVNFLTEDKMRDAGSKFTPDCLVLDECTINGQKVRWIDAKDFYGSGLRESNVMAKKMKKQIGRYEDAFGGSGAIVFKHGFSESFMQKFPSTLFLDAGPLHFDNVELL